MHRQQQNSSFRSFHLVAASQSSLCAMMATLRCGASLLWHSVQHAAVSPFSLAAGRLRHPVPCTSALTEHRSSEMAAHDVDSKSVAPDDAPDGSQRPGGGRSARCRVDAGPYDFAELGAIEAGAEPACPDHFGAGAGVGAGRLGEAGPGDAPQPCGAVCDAVSPVRSLAGVGCLPDHPTGASDRFAGPMARAMLCRP